MPRPRSVTAMVAVFVIVGFVAAGWSSAVASPRLATDPTPETTCEPAPPPHDAALPSDAHTSPSPSTSPTCPPKKMPFDLSVVCKPDPHHVILKITNRTRDDMRFVLHMVGTDVVVKGEARAKDSTWVTVPWKTPKDLWVLKIDDKRLEVKVDKPESCQKPTKTPSKSPTMTPSKSPTMTPTSPSASPSKTPLPVTGASMTSFGAAGLALLGAGILAVLAARRRRAHE